MTPVLGDAPTDVARGHVVLSLYDDSEEEALHRLKLAIASEAHAELAGAKTAFASVNPISVWSQSEKLM
jgi:hypothetical protein